jgi:uncharacterized membrane protein YccC
MTSVASKAPTSSDLQPSRRIAAIAVFVAGLAIALYTHLAMPGETSLWGLTPVLVFAIIALLGVDIVLSTIAAIVLGAIMTGTTPVGMGKLLADSLGSFIAVVGLIIVLGAGVGEVASRTGAAEQLVRHCAAYRLVQSGTRAPRHHGHLHADLRRAGHAGRR